MKYFLLISFLFAFSALGISQEYLDIIVEKACTCTEKLPEISDSQQYTMQFGVCVIEASIPYKKQILKDYKINLDNIDKEGEELGRLIGLKMAAKCPQVILKVAEKGNMVNNQQGATEQSAQGMIIKIENESFVILSLKDDLGKITKFYWLTFINAAFDMAGTYTLLVDKEVSIVYEVQEFFDPKIAEYRTFNIIKSLVVNETLEGMN
jgi:hypothetical protein